MAQSAVSIVAGHNLVVVRSFPEGDRLNWGASQRRPTALTPEQMEAVTLMMMSWYLDHDRLLDAERIFQDYLIKNPGTAH